MGRFGGSCNMVTEGYLSGGDAQVSWGTTVPLGRPFAVRDPVWAWGSGRSLISGDGSAIATIFAGLFFDGVTALLVYVLLVLMRGTSPGRSQWARAGPGRRGRPAASR